MFVDYLRLIASIVPFMPFLFRRLVQKIHAFGHYYTYEAVPGPKNVVVVGGSFAGLPLLRRLVETLPTGYRAVLVEPSSHFNFVFNFPRYSVIQGHEAKAFIPHDGLAAKAPTGIYKRVQDAVVRIVAAPNGGGGGEVYLAASSDKPLPYEYLVVATGASQPFPARARSTDKAGGCAELKTLQEHITAAETVAIIGGGAVGVELAADVKSYCPSKKVVLVHSREKLLPRFGGRLHRHVLPALEKLGVEVVLGERPDIVGNEAWGASYGPAALRFRDGREETFGLVITCTGQKPNTDIVAEMYPEAISEETGCILVKPTLQIATASNEQRNIFATGDVAETGGPKMARAGYLQAEIVCSNIIAMINGKEPSEVYRPIAMEGSTKLTLGKTDWVMYMQQENGTEILVSGKGGGEDLGIERFWKEYGAEFKEDGRD